MDRTVFSLPADLHYRVKALAARHKLSMAALIRKTLEEDFDSGSHRISENRGSYTAVAEQTREAGTMKRIVVSLPNDLHEKIRLQGWTRGVSMAAYVRDTLEERTRRERPKPSFGAFDSGFRDTSELAGELKFEPRSWR